MSQPLLIIAWAIIAVVLLLAARLARSAHAARSLPEALMSLFFIGGAGGYGLLILPATLEIPAESFATLRAVGNTGFLATHVAVVLFTLLVFRRESTWARSVAAVLVVGGVVGHVAGLALFGGEAGQLAAMSTSSGALLYWSGVALRAAGFSWACFEASAYYAKARRRVVLGLVDPLVANRFLLWACWSAMTSVLLVLRVVNVLLFNSQGAATATPAWLIVAQMLAGLVCITAVWLTFAAPSFYRRWVLAAAPG